jgi:hypothetical protein
MTRSIFIRLFCFGPKWVKGGNSLPLATVSLSAVSITHGQPQTENIKWKIPKIIHKF